MKPDRELLEVIQRLSLCRDTGCIVQVLREAARALTGADGVTVILRSGNDCHYVDENAISPLWKGKRFPLESCISGRCMTGRAQIAIEDIYADARIPHDLYRPTFVKSLAVTPIRSVDPLGAIGAYWASRHAATPDELEVLQALGDAAAVAFENARLIESLTEANRRKDEFLMMLAHELRNPLAPLRNAVHVLRSVESSPGSVERVRSMLERQVGHLAKITDDLLDAARVASGKLTAARDRLDLREVAGESVEDARGAAEAKGLALRATLPEVPVWVRGDRTRLAQALGNLLDNAIKFAPAGGTASVTLAAREDEAVLSVRDDGAGIDPQFLPRVFEPFSQADTTLDRARGGLGLGLTIAKAVAEMHGGTLQAKSEGPGKGAELTLSLPREAEPAAIAPASAERESARARSGLRVLVVEDNLDAAESLRMLLELDGHRVLMAHNGPDGLRVAAEARPQVVLCDIGLPGLDGYGVARALRASPDTGPIRLIAVTGYGGDARGKALEAGFDEHLVKPVEPRVLLERLAPSQH